MSKASSPALDPDSLKARIVLRACELGFHAVGVAPLEVEAASSEAYQAWVQAGHFGPMDYMARNQELRANPKGLLEGAESAIAVLVDYRSLGDPKAEPPPSRGGKIARYARARDYHIVLKKRLTRLGKFVQGLVPESEFRVCVDTAPLLERSLARRAGLGFFGKNTLLIRQKLGSYTLLGFLLTTLKLPPDPPGEGTCGRCTRCLDACPTQAFPEPGVLDARRCISTWTIETRGPLPQEAELSGWAFGCDICQEVCPYNWGGEPSALGDDFATPRARGAYLSPEDLSGIHSRQDFLELFAGTPLARSGLEGLRRNLKHLEGVEDPEPDSDG